MRTSLVRVAAQRGMTRTALTCLLLMAWLLSVHILTSQPCTRTHGIEPDHLKTPWPESESELYRQSDRHLLAKLVPTFRG
jgi:hypothetical protein